MRLFSLLFLLQAACPGPQPIPTPIGPVSDAAVADAPAPVPLFFHKVFDCHQDAVKSVYQAARPGIKTCMYQAGTIDCLVAQAGAYDPAVVACLARDVGADANASVLAGSADPGDASAANAARSFITSQLLGFR